MSDNVNHPSHYTDGCGFECFDVMKMVFSTDRVAIFCLINAFKYMWRYKMKNGLEDLRKAEWYLEKATILGDNLSEGEKNLVSELLQTCKFRIATLEPGFTFKPVESDNH